MDNTGKDNGIIDLQIQLAKLSSSLGTLLQVNEQQHLIITGVVKYKQKKYEG